MNEYINYIGISNQLPTDIKYFKEELFSDIIIKSNKLRAIGDIVSVAVDTKIDSTKILNTSERTSNEGRKLSGKKLLVEVNLSYNIKYTSNTIEKYLYIIKHNITKIVYIVVPKEIENTLIEEFLRHKKIQVQHFIEDLYAQKRTDNSIYLRTLLLLNANIKI